MKMIYFFNKITCLVEFLDGNEFDEEEKPAHRKINYYLFSWFVFLFFFSHISNTKTNSTGGHILQLETDKQLFCSTIEIKTVRSCTHIYKSNALGRKAS